MIGLYKHEGKVRKSLGKTNSVNEIPVENPGQLLAIYMYRAQK